MTDRTSEFRALIAQLPKPSVTAQAAPSSSSASQARSGSSSSSSSSQCSAAVTARFLANFHASAAIISKKIFETSQRLTHMSRLVQRKGLFDDPAEEINQLMYAIKEDIQSLNSLVETTQRSVDDFKYRAGSQSQQLTSHSLHVVGTLRTDLADATKTFKTLLRQRSSNVKEQFDRRGQYGVVRSTENALTLGNPTVLRPMSLPGPPPSAASGGGGGAMVVAGKGKPTVYRPMAFPGPPPSAASGGGGAIVVAGKDSYSSSSNGIGAGFTLPRPNGIDPTGTADYGGGGAAAPSAGGFQVTKHQQQQLLIPEQSYLEARAQAIEDVESHIVELGSIFNRLANMIAEQRELVERIEDNVDDAHENVSRTQQYLLSVYSRLSGNGPLMMKSALVLIVFVILFVLFIA